MPLLASLPAAYGVYAIRSSQRTLHLSSTSNLRRRLTRLLDRDRPAGARLTQKIAEHSAFVECWTAGSSLENALQMYALGMRFFPADYFKRLRLRLPWFLNVTEDAFPRLNISNRLEAGPPTVLGPFSSREQAARYEEAVLPLFQIRRCAETLHPHLEHPGCVYGEMNLCLRPCQLHVSAEEYSAELERARHFLTSGPGTTLANLSLARDRAANQLEFEWASQLHKQMERVSACEGARPDVVTDLQNFNGVALTPGVEPSSYCLRLLLQGLWQESVTLQLSIESGRETSLDTRLRQLLEGEVSRHAYPGKRGEHLALFLRWHNSHSKTGEWFPFSVRHGLPYRKLARGVSRLSKLEAETAVKP